MVPRDGRSGLSLAGTIGGRQLAISDGLPRLDVGDCDLHDDRDADVCFISRDIDGELIVLVFENPAALVEGEALPVRAGECLRPEDCDAVTDHLIVELQRGVGDRIRATGGTVRLTTVERFLRYAGELRLEFPDGALSGSFDVVPRPE